MENEYPPPGQGPGARLVPPNWIITFLVIQIALAVAVVFAMFNTMPAMPLQGVQTGANTPLDYEKTLLQVTGLAGSLGGLLHGLRSYVWYVGNRDLRWSWIPTYFALPVTGALISVVFYLVIRAGFVGLGGQGTPNFIGFAGAGALIGLFQAPAMLKLKAVAETLFTKPEAGSDARPQDENEPRREQPTTKTKLADTAVGLAPAPVIVDATLAQRNGAFELTVQGTGFRPTSELFVDGVKLATTSTTTKQIVAKVASRPATVQVQTPPPGGGKTAAVPVRGSDA